MRLVDYKFLSQTDRLKYLDSQRMLTGIPYFGGKSKIGKYLNNIIYNMAVDMYDNDDKPHIFVDAFTGGGKMGLSIPNGWFDKIVMNDLDYGVYSFYWACQNDYRRLLLTIDRLFEIINTNTFKIFLGIREERTLDKFMAGAMTWICASTSFNNILDFNKASYKFAELESGEKQLLNEIKERAHKKIPLVAKRLASGNYIIENMDYEQLINKYTGQDYFDVEQIKHKGLKEYSNISNNILWFLDPPYMPLCLAGTDEAPYSNSFSIEMVKHMTEVLSQDKRLKYFIKCDYDPKEKVKTLEEMKKLSSNEFSIIKNNKQLMQTIFNPLEDESKGFQKICVGTFNKGAHKKVSEDSNKKVIPVGKEYVWTHGLRAGYNELEKITIKEKLLH